VNDNLAAVGFRVKSGRAIAVLISGTPDVPMLLDLRTVALSDPAVPDSMQPFHAALRLRPDEAPAEVARLVAIVERFSARSVCELLQAYAERAGQMLAGAGVVAGSLVDPATIKQNHIRAHAEEGRLFRSVVVDAAEAFGLRTYVYAEKNLYGEASVALRRSIPQLKTELQALGEGVDGAWRAEEKGAALAALTVLFAEAVPA
jgi:hypothetical protein